MRVSKKHRDHLMWPLSFRNNRYTNNKMKSTIHSEIALRFVVNFVYIVPAPTITINGLPAETLYAGTGLQLTCQVELHNGINTEVGVEGVWQRGGQVISNGSRTYILSFRQIQPMFYETVISISPASDSSDNGQYSCESTITSNSGASYTVFAMGYQSLAVSIEGKIVYTICFCRAKISTVTPLTS